MKRTVSIFVMLVCLTACVSLPKATTVEQRVVETPTIYEINQGNVPADIKLVSAAIIYKLRGVENMVEHVSFSPDGFIQVTEDGFYYEGFEMTNMVITGYEETVIDPNAKTSVTLEGVLSFKDEFLRKAGVYFAATYTVTRQGIVIQNAMAYGVPPEEPQVEAYMVPATLVKEADPEIMRGYLPLYIFAVENAVPMTCAPGQKQIQMKRDYFLMIFTKDRIFDDSTMEMKVSKYRTLTGKALTDPTYIGENGWRIMIAGGQFSPGSGSDRFYFGVDYDAEPGPDSKPVRIALFSNEIQEIDPNAMPATEQQPYNMMQPTEEAPAAQQTPAVADGPIAQGKVFLNPIMKQDAMAIQTRLKELGHYPGKVDGAFGKGSKKALDSFAASQGMSSAAWTLKMQKALFKGSGK